MRVHGAPPASKTFSGTIHPYKRKLCDIDTAKKISMLSGGSGDDVESPPQQLDDERINEGSGGDEDGDNDENSEGVRINEGSGDDEDGEKSPQQNDENDDYEVRIKEAALLSMHLRKCIQWLNKSIPLQSILENRKSLGVAVHAIASHVVASGDPKGKNAKPIPLTVCTTIPVTVSMRNHVMNPAHAVKNYQRLQLEFKMAVKDVTNAAKMQLDRMRSMEGQNGGVASNDIQTGEAKGGDQPLVEKAGLMDIHKKVKWHNEATSMVLSRTAWTVEMIPLSHLQIVQEPGVFAAGKHLSIQEYKSLSKENWKKGESDADINFQIVVRGSLVHTFKKQRR